MHYSKAVDFSGNLAGMFGSVDRMFRWLFLFLTGLAVVLFAVLAGVAISRSRHPEWPAVLLTILGLLAPWLVLSPLVRHFLRRQTMRALDNLLENAAMMAPTAL